jgi:TatD DNase family protein
MHKLIDIGANLTHDSFNKDREVILQRAFDAGVSRIIVTGTTLESSQDAVQLSRSYPGCLYATAGVHPHHAGKVDEVTLTGLQELAADPSIVAIGECGLDYFRNYSPRDTQLDAFEKQLALAAGTDKPVFLHQREAHDDFTSLLKNFLSQIPGGVAHCFTGDRDEMKTYLDMGLYIGITGWICDERRGEALRDAARYLPLDRVLLETDAPYLLPRDLQDKPSGRRNEPSVLPHVLHAVASCMKQPVEAVVNATTQNTELLFRLSVI